MKKYVAALALTLATLGLYPAQAGADPANTDAAMLCRLIDTDPSPAGVVAAVDSMRDTQAIKAAIWSAFTVHCPEYVPLMVQAERTWDLHPCYDGRTGLSDPICARAHTLDERRDHVTEIPRRAT